MTIRQQASLAGSLFRHDDAFGFFHSPSASSRGHATARATRLMLTEFLLGSCPILSAYFHPRLTPEMACSSAGSSRRPIACLPMCRSRPRVCRGHLISCSDVCGAPSRIRPHLDTLNGRRRRPRHVEHSRLRLSTTPRWSGVLSAPATVRAVCVYARESGESSPYKPLGRVTSFELPIN